MAKTTITKDPFRCSECGWSTTKWVGRCGECQTWGSVEEISAPKKLSLVPGKVTTAAQPIGEVNLENAKARSSGVSELDRVLGGGLVPGAAILLAGEPGVGKSTLLLSVAAQSARLNLVSLYISGEESASQVRLRAQRLNAIEPQLWLASENDLSAVIAHIDAVKPQLLIIDSIQTIASSAVEGSPGGVTQVREIAAALIRIAKERSITLVLVGHVTKDGSIAGPRILEHLVDVVLNFEGDRHCGRRVRGDGVVRVGSEGAARRAAVARRRRMAVVCGRPAKHPLLAARANRWRELQDFGSGLALQDRQPRSASRVQARRYAGHGQGCDLHHGGHASIGRCS